MNELDRAILRYRRTVAELDLALAALSRVNAEVSAKVATIDGTVPAPPRIVVIQTVVAGHFGFTRERMLIRDKHAEVSRARMAAMALCREFTRRTWAEIARFFGGLSHMTPMHAVKAIQDLSDTNAAFATELAAVRAKVSVAASAIPDHAEIGSASANSVGRAQ